MIVISPCNSKCSLGKDGRCVSCKRSVHAIANWTLFTNDEKRAIMKEIKKLTGV